MERDGLMERQTLSIPEAGKVLRGLKRTASYRLFNTDPPVPVLVIGGQRCVSKVQIERYLAGEPTSAVAVRPGGPPLPGPAATGAVGRSSCADAVPDGSPLERAS